MTLIKTLITLSLNWIYVKLEYISSIALGLTAITVDVPQTILKVILAFVLGFLGAAGGWVFKWIIAKLTKKK